MKWNEDREIKWLKYFAMLSEEQQDELFYEKVKELMSSKYSHQETKLRLLKKVIQGREG